LGKSNSLGSRNEAEHEQGLAGLILSVLSPSLSTESGGASSWAVINISIYSIHSS
jgi:hypothetical protein